MSTDTQDLQLNNDVATTVEPIEATEETLPSETVLPTANQPLTPLNTDELTDSTIDTLQKAETTEPNNTIEDISTQNSIQTEEPSESIDTNNVSPVNIDNETPEQYLEPTEIPLEQNIAPDNISAPSTETSQLVTEQQVPEEPIEIIAVNNQPESTIQPNFVPNQPFANNNPQQFYNSQPFATNNQPYSGNNQPYLGQQIPPQAGNMYPNGYPYNNQPNLGQYPQYNQPYYPSAPKQQANSTKTNESKYPIGSYVAAIAAAIIIVLIVTVIKPFSVFDTGSTFNYVLNPTSNTQKFPITGITEDSIGNVSEFNINVTNDNGEEFTDEEMQINISTEGKLPLIVSLCYADGSEIFQHNYCPTDQVEKVTYTTFMMPNSKIKALSDKYILKVQWDTTYNITDYYGIADNVKISLEKKDKS